MKSTEYQPLRGDVSARIRERIVDGTYPAGSRLVERTIAAELGVSRVPVREALHTLVRDGFAVERDTGGTAVRTYEPHEIDELFEVRAALEGVIVDHLTQATDELTPLRDNLEDVKRHLDAGDVDAAVAANAEFHAIMARIGHGPMVRGLLVDLDARMRWLLSQHSDPAAIHAEHRELVEAMESGDARRVHAVNRRHLATSRQAFDAEQPG
ncbi:GntR family transcriptional regulator [Aeromicrobium terrae]|uniref:GntR family transcriptional regulator n=1 Tax=Aeromicrobium terrae TaxID=2498846 RepID=UPI0016502F12|nr:GntR family transcriptional regulator [Aeromicrobium terrae]